MSVDQTISDVTDLAMASAAGGFAIFIGNTLSALFSAITVVLLTRLLEPSEYGLYTLVFIVPSFLVLLADWGINTALTRYVANFKTQGKINEAWSVAKAGILFKLLVGMSLLLVPFFLPNQIAYLLNRPGIQPYVMIASLLVVAQVLYDAVLNVMVGAGKMKIGALLMFIQAATRAVLVLVLILLGLGILGALLGFVLSYATAGLIGAAYLSPTFRRFACSTKGHLSYMGSWRLMIPYGFPLFIGSIVTGLVTQYTQLLLPWFASNTEIGNYKVAVNFLALLTILVIPITTAIFPAFSKLDANVDRKKLRILFDNFIRYSVLLVVPATLATMVLAKDLAFTLFGSKYSLAPLFLSLYAIIGIDILLGSVAVRNFFESQGRTTASLKITLVQVTIAIPLCTLLIWLRGILGLILGLIISDFAMHIYGVILIHRSYGLNINPDFSLRVFIASLLPTILVYLLLHLTTSLIPIHNLLIGVSVFVLGYLITAPLMGAVSRQDISNLHTVMKIIKPLYPFLATLLTFEQKLILWKEKRWGT